MGENKNNKIELSLSAIMFFAPLIRNKISTSQKISPEEKNFVLGFIKLGNVNIFLLVLNILLQIFYYFYDLAILKTIGIVLISILGISLTIGSIFAISNKSIFSKDIGQKTNHKKNLLYYIPIYNIYIRYKKHNFENPNIEIKESLIFRGLLTMVAIVFKNTNILIAISILGIIKLILNINGVNLGDKYKNFINSLFEKNPEEIRSYISATIKSIFNKKTLSENLQEQKDYFRLLVKSNTKKIIFQYAIFYIICIYLLYIGYTNENILLIFATIIMS
ncbi:MAG TPA: hypothetical protein P5060_01175 [Candidatus Absconditabacterales bacterium]|nr:hypothetical protein [Candidatus Absconditabacterales bacterium]